MPPYEADIQLGIAAFHTPHNLPISRAEASKVGEVTTC